MVVVLLVATALRVTALPNLPVGLHYDEAANVILTRQIASGDYRPVFIRAYTGKEVLFFYAGALWVEATGGAPWGLRLNAAMFGVLTVAATYAVTRALFGSDRRARWMALLAAGWVAVAFPHVLLSRYGFRAISQPLLQALTVAALWHGLRSGKRRWFAAGGAFLGLTGYTYLAARLFPLPLALALGWVLIHTRRDERLRRAGQFGLALLAALIVFAPLGLYFVRYPDAFTTRITQVAAPTWRDALRGLGLCIRALVWPGAGDPYIRFNIPGKPVLDAVSAGLALIGLAAILCTGRKETPDDTARLFVVAAIATMLLPSALATSEITPSNLRLVGLFPFIAILPAYGVVWLSGALKGDLTQRSTDVKNRFSPLAACLWLLLLLGGLTTGRAYRQWATSAALFYSADGEMLLAAKALDATEASHTTVYIASEHYRHPTVAALARQYPQAKWLTGGMTLVLPPAGDAVYMLPRSLTPPTAWPDAITRQWQSTVLTDPAGEPALWVQRLTAAQIAALRPTPPPVADFAHVVQVYDAHAVGPCRVAEPCAIQITWSVGAPYTTLQPVVRLWHPDTGEWVRTTAFHYPPEQWTVGDVVFDRFLLVPPVGTPPVDGYQIGVGFFNPDSGEALPRLVAERFAGLEARFPLTTTLLPLASAPDEAQSAEACVGIPRDGGTAHAGVLLLGYTPLPDSLRPGEATLLRLCWQATGASRPQDDVSLRLSGPQQHTFYAGAPARGYGFSQWQTGTIIEDRYTLRIPKAMPPGHYTLTLSIGQATVAVLGEVDIQAVAHTFTPPHVAHPFTADFGARVRLLGYDVGTFQAGQPLDVTLYWQAAAEMTEDYLVFVHVFEVTEGHIVAQVDEAPQTNGYPTSLWVEGEIVADPHTLFIPDDLPAGDYRLRVGFYRQENGDYLAVNGDTSLLLPLTDVQP